jgi:hypothetical protein
MAIKGRKSGVLKAPQKWGQIIKYTILLPLLRFSPEVRVPKVAFKAAGVVI